MLFKNGTAFLKIRAPNLAPQKWLLTAKLMAIYGLFYPIIIGLIYLSSHLNLSVYQTTHQNFFYPLSQFPALFWPVVREAIFEEIVYRGPVWILTVSGLTLTAKYYQLTPFLIALVILLPNVYWTTTHDVLVPLVFASGLGWGWLVYKTKALWPAVISHATANLLIYFSIKFVGLFIKI